MASVETNKMLAVAAAACDDKKAEDVRILALDPAESGLSDYFLVCTGTNDRQTVAITDEIELRLKHEFGTYPNAVEGRRQGEWILMDYVDFIVHVFLPEKRAFYGLERLRPSATTLSVADLNAEIKAAIRAERVPKRASAAGAVAEADSDGNSPADAADTASRPATRKRAIKSAGKAASLPTKATARKTGVPRPVAKKSAVKKRAVKTAVSAKALDTRGAAKAAVKGARKPAAKKRTRSSE